MPRSMTSKPPAAAIRCTASGLVVQRGEEEYTLVQRGEADPAQGRISTESPVGWALLGRRSGDEVEVQTPGGVRVLTLVELAAPRCCSLEE